ncbi:capZ-interacting protein isoform X1 [Myripristis murdjan]|uniref:capZ-interacting protein isoform X1 n=1 Tax=Myripristis murdjan TaxID=586833 RepID=UPI00117604EF|nr:capZ-interacting protein-like isoform X1 [Myripristis murdjan]XP_029922979.1 capZ-interacting protein-like isoform X1 [Myripristis murdjan]
MEKDSPSKPSVAELAGRFKGHVLPMPASNEERPFRRPPCSLKLQNQKDDSEESDKPTAVSSNPFKIKMKNSPIIEKLQANLALSPTALLPSPKSPEVKLQPAPLSPTAPCSPQSPTLRPSQQSSEDEDAVSFETPPEGTTLPSINKTRARLSFKRRPPTRQHRRSAGEEAAGFGSSLSPSELSNTKENGDRDHVFESPEEEAEDGQQASLRGPEERDRDCEKTEDEVAENDLTKRGSPDSQISGEQTAEQPQTLEALEGERQLLESSSAMPTGGSNNLKEREEEELEEEEEEEIPQEAHQAERSDRV